MASLHVSHLHPDTTAVDLCKKFQQAGPLESVKVCQDWNTKKSLGYGYVNFQQPADAEWALYNYYGHKIKKVPMVISWSRTSAPETHTGWSDYKQPKASAAKPNAGASPAARDLREKINAARPMRQAANKKPEEKLDSSSLRTNKGSSAEEHRDVAVNYSSQEALKPEYRAHPATLQAINIKNADPAVLQDLREKLIAMRRPVDDKMPGGDEKLQCATQQKKVPEKREARNKKSPAEGTIKKVVRTASYGDSINTSEEQTAAESSSESGPCKVPDKKKKQNKKRENNEELDKKKGSLWHRFTSSCRRKLSRLGRTIRNGFRRSPTP